MDLDPSAVAAGTRIITYDTIDSTNARALALARAGEAGPLWVVARSQSAGRGRRGRRWVSPPGNLYATLLLIDPSPPDRAAQLSFVAALALRDALIACAPARSPEFAFKWPNDVLCGGAKLAGILIEGEGTKPLAVALGIGVNCVNHPQQADYPATDLRAAGISTEASDVFHALSAAMLRRLAQWNRGSGFAAVRADWLTAAQGLGEQIRVHLADREMQGRFDAIDANGRLILRRADGSREIITAGDVFPLLDRVTMPAAQ